MDIVVTDGCINGFANWSEVCSLEIGPKIDKDICEAAGVREVAADPDLINGVMIAPERAHRPWLVPGAGRL